ncbi:MAG: isoaspartyl peptidase/L-asparaginase [Gemmatimonadota bacterium]
MPLSRRDFLATSATTAAALAIPASRGDALPSPVSRLLSAPRPVVVASANGIRGVKVAYDQIVAGTDTLDAIIAGVNIPELDPLEMGIGYGALPNADGVVQLDASCMHGPKRRAGAVAAIEGVRTPSKVAKAVMDYTDHHLLSGTGAREFARALGFPIEDDLNTPASRKAWLEWKRRVDAEHWLDPEGTGRRQKPKHERDPGNDAASADVGSRIRLHLAAREWESRALAAGRSMVRDGLIR